MSKVKLGEVAIEHKETCKGSKDGYPIVGLEHLVPEEVTLTAWNEGSDNTFTKMFRKGNVLFGRRRAYLKKAAVAPFDGICSGDITVIEAIPDRILPELLPFIIQNDDLFDFAVGKSAGSLSPRVKWEHLRNYEFELPDMDKQRELTKLLWAMDATKKSYQKLIAATDELVKSQFMEQFASLIMDDAKCSTIEKVCTLFADGDWIESKDQSDDGIRLIQTGNIGNGVYLDKGERARFINEPTFERLHCTEVLPNDILISRLPDPVGRACVIPEGLGMTITAVDCSIVRLNQKVLPEFFVAYTLTPLYTFQIGTSVTGSTRKRISRRNLGQVIIPVPSLDLQEQFAAFVRQSDKSKFAALWSANKAMLSIKDLMAVLKYNKIPAVPSEIICCTASIAGIGTIYSRRQRDMFTIDKDKFHHAVWELIGRVISEQSKNGTNDPTKVTFNSGWFKDEEWYKRDVWDEAQGILQVDTWSEETIKTLDLTGRIIRCMDVPMESGKKQNLLDWRETDDNGGNSLKKRITADKELSDIAIYQIFRGDDESHAFQDAVKIWGAKYPFITFLFFLKDINHFAVVRPVAMKKRFERLGILSDCLNVCSWKNYQEFLEILKELKRLLKEEIDPATELIDAHSFLWATWLLEKTEIDPLSDQFEQIERDLSCKEIVGDVRKAVVKVRVNQSVFRDCLLEQGKKCAICGVDHPALLTASHISLCEIKKQ